VKAFVEEFCGLAKRFARPQNEKIFARGVKRTTTSATAQSWRRSVEAIATIWTSDELEQPRRNHGNGSG
jgi:hypothetical protein